MVHRSKCGVFICVGFGCGVCLCGGVVVCGCIYDLGICVGVCMDSCVGMSICVCVVGVGIVFQPMGTGPPNSCSLALRSPGTLLGAESPPF